MPRSAVSILAVPVVAALIGGCGTRHTLPTIGAGEVQAARRSIPMAPPLVSNGRSTQASAAMLDSVARHMTAAAQPLCFAYLHTSCGFQVALDGAEGSSVRKRTRPCEICAATDSQSAQDALESGP